MTEDRYLNNGQIIERLLSEYKKYDYIYVAFDFDNTVFDYHGVGDTFPEMEKLLHVLKSMPKVQLVLFTAMEGKQLEDAIQYCKDHGYEPDYVNESPIMPTKKPYYTILLDDRAGLREAFDALWYLIWYFERGDLK
jgi:hypothetical protein